MDALSDAERTAPVARIVSAAITAEKAVPVALLLAIDARRERGGARGMTIAEARAAIAAQPVLQRLICGLVPGSRA